MLSFLGISLEPLFFGVLGAPERSSTSWTRPNCLSSADLKEVWVEEAFFISSAMSGRDIVSMTLDSPTTRSDELKILFLKRD